MVAICLTLWVAPAPDAVAARDASIATPGVRIEPVARLDSLQLTAQSWSPRGTRLALLRDTTEVWVMDAARPALQPRRVYRAPQRIQFCGWSPAGTWVLLLLRDPDPSGVQRLVAVPCDGDRSDTLHVGARIWFAFWGSDGMIYCRVPMSWDELAPPQRWDPRESSDRRLPLAFYLVPGLDVSFRPPDPRQMYELVCVGPTFRQDGMSLKVIDALPDGSRILVTISDAGRRASRVVNREGRTVLDLGEVGVDFAPGALSADGRWIVGTAMEGNPEIELPETWLEIADAGGRWTAPIQGGREASDPQMSRSGSYIAWRGLHGTRIGRLVVDRR